jgi:peptidyl-prolyl cis-trans isomerase SurA
LIAGELRNPAGVYSLQVLFRPGKRFGFAALCLFGGALMQVISGCHRPPSAGVVATVNGKEIQRDELEKNYQSTLLQNPQSPSPQEADIARMRVLDQMIQEEVLQQQAAKLNLTASDDEVNARLTEIKAPYTEDQFYNMMKQRNLTIDEFKREVRRQLTDSKLINKEIESKIDVTDAEIAQYYTAHKTEFNLIEPRYHLAEIVVTTTPSQQSPNLQNNKALGEADARKKIDALYSRLESGQDFATVAANFSEDPRTASNGGDMGFAYESDVRSDPAVFDAIGKLKPGQFTDVIPAYDPGPGHRLAGYGIYKLISREPAGQRELNDPNVRQAIHQQLHDGEEQLLKTAYIENLMDEARIRNFLAEQILKQNGQ